MDLEYRIDVEYKRISDLTARGFYESNRLALANDMGFFFGLIQAYRLDHGTEEIDVLLYRYVPSLAAGLKIAPFDSLAAGVDVWTKKYQSDFLEVDFRTAVAAYVAQKPYQSRYYFFYDNGVITVLAKKGETVKKECLGLNAIFFYDSENQKVEKIPF